MCLPVPSSGVRATMSAAGRGAARPASGAVEPAELGGEVRAGPPPATAFLDGLLEGPQRSHHDLTVGLPAASLALLEPLGRGAMASLAVAAAARRDLVLEPARATLDPGDQMLGGRPYQPDLQRSPAPHTGRAVALEDRLEAFPPVQGSACCAVGTHRHHNGAMSGRFAPSPTGPLHLGNLRTALAAWLAARSSGRGFLVRMEDLDRVTSSPLHEQAQLEDLTQLGLDWDGPVVRQSERFDRYRAALTRLDEAGLVYPCYCTRREIRSEIEAAASAPHGLAADGAYPGTCRDLSAGQRAERTAAGRRPALRLRAEGERIVFRDDLVGTVEGLVDDVVLARSDGVPAYNLAVVVDDAAQGVTQVVRGDDLLSSTPRQVHLQRLLGLPTPSYLHVPLVLGPDGARLAKRHGAVTLAELTVGLGRAERDRRVATILSALAVSLGVLDDGEVVEPGELDGLIDRFDVVRLPRAPLAWSELAALLA